MWCMTKILGGALRFPDIGSQLVGELLINSESDLE